MHAEGGGGGRERRCSILPGRVTFTGRKKGWSTKQRFFVWHGRRCLYETQDDWSKSNLALFHFNRSFYLYRSYLCRSFQYILYVRVSVILRENVTTYRYVAESFTLNFFFFFLLEANNSNDGWLVE
jgi:hypothetical protein